MIRAFLAAVALLAALPSAAQPARFEWFGYSGEDPADRLPKAEGDYRNPILRGFYPDPSITRVGRDFYLVTSTFSYFPGIPVFHSRDLVNWTQIGNAIDRPGQLDFKRLGLSRGVFAPTIAHKDGLFYILNTCVDCGGNFVITARHPKGPWSDPIWLPALEGGIDPSLFFDDDGRSWILNNGPPDGKPLYEGHRAIWIQEFDLRRLRTFGPRTLLVNGGVDLSTRPIWIEGPHIFRKDGWYYLSAAEGGTAEGHSQVILRSRSVTGPFVPGPRNPILTQRDLPADRPTPITSAGHAQLVTTFGGEWWATFLAVQPYRGDYYSTGRETFLLPVRWEDGWPRITAPGQVIPHVRARPKLPAQPAPALPPSGAFTLREEFAGPELPLHWMMWRNPRERWYALRGGALELTPRAAGLGDNANPSLLVRRQQHMNATASTSVLYRPRAEGDRAGLVVAQSDDAWFFLGLRRVEGRTALVLEQRLGANDPQGGRRVRLLDDPRLGRGRVVGLQIEVRGNRYRFSYGKLGRQPTRKPAWVTFAEVETDALTTKSAGGFVGSVFGVFAGMGGGG
jgi:xylan 1,4-beta-xylosidase